MAKTNNVMMTEEDKAKLAAKKKTAKKPETKKVEVPQVVEPLTFKQRMACSGTEAAGDIIGGLLILLAVKTLKSIFDSGINVNIREEKDEYDD